MGLKVRAIIPSTSVASFNPHSLFLFSFFSLRLALANQVETCVSVILVIIASMILSALVGYGFLRCSTSHALSVSVDSRLAFLR